MIVLPCTSTSRQITAAAGARTFFTVLRIYGKTNTWIKVAFVYSFATGVTKYYDVGT